MLHSTVARRVRWRSGTSTAPVPKASNELLSRCSNASGSSRRERAAASSMASGRPSRRRAISATAAALAGVSAKSWRTALARSTNSCTGGDEASASGSAVAGSGGSASGGTAYSLSARSRRAIRQVARIVTPAQRASSSLRSRAASTTCSRLSRMSSHRSSPKWSTRACSGEAAPAISAPTSRPIAPRSPSGLVTDSSGTNATPAGKPSAVRSPTASASRVLPIPPGPVSVTSRASGLRMRPVTSSIACSRPTSDVVATGRGSGPRAAGDSRGASASPGRVTSNRSLSSVARSSRTSRPSSAAVRNRRYEASCRTRESRSARRGSRSGAGTLT